MLEGMRRHANSFVMSLMFAIIILVFLFSFGPGSAKYCGNALPIAATVNGHAISSAELQQSYSQTFDRMQRSRPNYTIDTARAENLVQTVVDQLVGRQLLLQEAAARGIMVTDDQLAKEIVSSPYFQRDGVFDRELYRRYATSLNLSEASYEASFREDLVAQRMQSILLDTVPVGESEIRELWDRRNNKVDIWFVRVDPFPLRRGVEVSDAEVATFAKDQRARVEDHYNQFATRYNQPEKVRARHILIKVAEDAAADQVADAQARIDEAKKRADSGKDFAELARELSEDSSAAQGGDLGAQVRGAWVKPFEEAAFALAPGEVSAVVRSQFGFHIIKVEEKVEAQSRSVDEAAEEIAREVLTEERSGAAAAALAKEWLAKLASSEDPETLNPAQGDETPDPFAPKVESTGSFERTQRFIPKIGVAGELVDAAFALTEEAPVPDAPLEVNKRFFAYKLKQRETPDPTSYDTDKERLRTELAMRRQMRVVDDFIKHLRAAAQVDISPGLLENADQAATPR